MATLSFALPGASLFQETLGRFRWDRAHTEPVRRKPVRFPQPQAVPVPGIARDVVVKIASEPDEWEQAFRLVAANYQEAGYQVPTGKPYRFTPHHALPDTTVFVAKQGSRVLATFSLVADNSVLGLPIDALYAGEVAALRRQGRCLAEVTSLAFTELGQREFLQVFTTLIKLMKQYHVSRGGDTWVISVNPRHRTFYTKVLGYRPLGACKPYAAVGNAPAEGYVLDRDMMRSNAPNAYERIFGEWLPSEALTGVSLPRPFIRYFWGESNQADDPRINALLGSLAVAGNPRAW